MCEQLWPVKQEMAGIVFNIIWEYHQSYTVLHISRAGAHIEFLHYFFSLKGSNDVNASVLHFEQHLLITRCHHCQHQWLCILLARVLGNSNNIILLCCWSYPKSEFFIHYDKMRKVIPILDIETSIAKKIPALWVPFLKTVIQASHFYWWFILFIKSNIN